MALKQMTLVIIGEFPREDGTPKQKPQTLEIEVNDKKVFARLRDEADLSIVPFVQSLGNRLEWHTSAGSDFDKAVKLAEEIIG